MRKVPQLTVGSSANMAPGRIIILDQLDDQSDNGGFVNGYKYPTLAIENISLPPGRHDSADGRVTRSQVQIVHVVSVNDSTHVTIDPGVYMPNWRSGQSPEIWRVNGNIGYGTTDADTIFGVGCQALTDLTMPMGAG